MRIFKPISRLADLQAHPKLGASWEGFALQQVVDLLETRDAYFWGTHGGAELDLLVIIGGKRYGFEFKYADAPGRTRSMMISAEDLGLERLWIIYPGSREYDVDATISAVPLASVPGISKKLRGL